MAQIPIRNLDQKTVDRLMEQAKLHGRSLQAEAKMLLETSLGRKLSEFKVDMETARKQCEEF